jgi:hypothetical protein
LALRLLLPTGAYGLAMIGNAFVIGTCLDALVRSAERNWSASVARGRMRATFSVVVLGTGGPWI